MWWFHQCTYSFIHLSRTIHKIAPLQLISLIYPKALLCMYMAFPLIPLCNGLVSYCSCQTKLVVGTSLLLSSLVYPLRDGITMNYSIFRFSIHFMIFIIVLNWKPPRKSSTFFLHFPSSFHTLFRKNFV